VFQLPLNAFLVLWVLLGEVYRERS
jgi:hypothetical protein